MSLPSINYIGNKEKLAEWIISNIPDDARTFLDAFSGGASVGYAAKERGLEVYSNDILAVNYQLAKAFIENPGTTLTDEDVAMIFGGTPFDGFMTENYSDVYYFKAECQELDLARRNIDRLDDEYKKAMAFALLRRAMVRKMPYSRFTINWEKIQQLRDEEYSYLTYKRKRAYHNQSFQHHVMENLHEYNFAVFDNGRQCKAYNMDVFDLVQQVRADVIYLDPPYTGTMNDYHGFYGPIDDYILQKRTLPFSNSFTDRKEALALFERLLSSLGNYKYVMLSYNNASVPTREQLMFLFSLYAKEVQVVERPHTYKVTGKEKKNKNIELLFIAKYQ